MVLPAGYDIADGVQGGIDEDCIKAYGELNVKGTIAEALGEFE